MNMVGTLYDNDARMLEDAYTSSSPLHYAAVFGLQDIIERTIKSNKWKIKRNKWSWTYSALLGIASEKGYIGIVRLLLDKGANVNAQSGHLGNALQAVSCRGCADIAELLLDKGADVNTQGGDHGNALQAASWGGHAENVRLLLKGVQM